MAKAAPKIVLSPTRDIPLNLIDLAQTNVRRVKNGVSIEALAEDIARGGLLQSLNVRPSLNDDGEETGRFHAPAGGRRYLALQLLVKRKRLAKNALTPCIVKDANDPISEEEDSLAENTHREQLHPLDEFRAMQRLAEQGSGVEAIAARFTTTPAVVKQRLKLASVSPKLHDVYAEDGMTLDQLMAFSISDDHERQEQVWEMLAHSWNKEPSFIRARLTENMVRASDRRVLFIGVDAYLAAGGAAPMRDLFEPDDGGWLSDPALIDRLVAEKLKGEGERIGAEGWKWVAVAVDFPYGYLDDLREIDGVKAPLSEEDETRLEALKAEAETLEDEWAGVDDVPEEVEQRFEAIDEEIASLVDRPKAYDPADMAVAGAFVSLDTDGTLYIERGFVRPEDEPRAEAEGAEAEGEEDGDEANRPDPVVQRAVITIGGTPAGSDDDDADDEAIKPLPDRLVAELTAQRTIALQDAFAQSPSTAFTAVLHALVLSTFYLASRESCVGVAVNKVTFGFQAPGMKDSAPARSIAERHDHWKARLPKSDKDLWDALQRLDGAEQANLFAHSAAFGVNALWEAVPKYDNGRVSAHSVELRLAHSHVLARAVGLDMVATGWKPTVDNYLGRVTKPRILEAVTEAKGSQTASLIDHLKKGDMAREAERLMDEAAWLPEPLRTPELGEPTLASASTDEDEALPAFLGDGDPDDEDEASDAHAIAAE